MKWASAIACASFALAAGGCGGNGGGSASSGGGGEASVTLGQPLQIPAYFSLDYARASNLFKSHGVALNWVLGPDGDSVALAALKSGDLSVAAPGTETPVIAVAKGEPYEFVYCLDAQLGLQLVVSNQFLKRAGVSPSSPLQARLQALKGVTIGVSAVGGLQDQVARYYLKQGGLDPTAAKIAQIGPPPAIIAALESGRIDAFVLSPPEGQEVEADGKGKVLISGSEVPGVKEFCDLALVTTKDYARTHGDVLRRITATLADASKRIQANPEQALEAVRQAYYPKVPANVLLRAKDPLVAGTKGDGRMTPAMMDAVVKFAESTGTSLPRQLSGASGEGDWWTNEYLPKG